jgi:glycosyltransferase involved in cell wall biosynthesis
MNVLFVTQGYYPTIGGVEWLIQRVSEELVGQFGDEITVFTTNCYNGEGFFNPRIPRLPVGWQEINGVRVRRFPVLSRVSQLSRLPQALAYHLNLPGNQYLRSVASGPIIPGLGAAIRQQPADLVVAASFPLLHMYTALRVAQNKRIPCVLVGGLHPLDDWGFNREMIYQAICAADGYIALTDYERDYVIDRGAIPERIVTIGLGVDPERFEHVSNNEARNQLGLGEAPLVGFIGQLGGHKGVDTLIRAMPLVWKSRLDTNFLIAGARTLFSERMERMISQLPEADQAKVKLHYNFSEEEKPRLFAAIDVFAYPSGYESFGISFLEAWMVKKPVVGCRRGAIPWVVNPGRDGLLVKYQNHEMLAEALLLLLSNPKWSRQLGQAGKQKVLAQHTWPLVASRFRDVFSSVLEKQNISFIA